MLYRIDREGHTAEPIEPATFAALGIYERRDLQECILRRPAMLGEDLLIITSEFDGFDVSRDRLDILAVDEYGKLVVVELKRGRTAAYADLQALRYAAMVAPMTSDDVVALLARTDSSSEDEARAKLAEFLKTPFDEINFDDQPRIILASEDFGTELTTTVLWLTQQFSLQISCVRLIAYEVGGEVYLARQTIIPIPEAHDYQVKLQRKEASVAAISEKRRRRMNTVPYLRKHGLVKPGDVLQLDQALPAYLRDKAPGDWCRATVTDESSSLRFMRWAEDGEVYAVSQLTWRIFRDQHPSGVEPGAVNGNVHWSIEGQPGSLWEIAERHRAGRG